MKSMSLSIKGVQLWNYLDSSQMFCFKKNHKAKILNSYESDIRVTIYGKKLLGLGL